MKLLIQTGRVLDPVSKTVTLTDLLAENGRVALLEGGLTHNAIPSWARAVVFCQTEPQLTLLEEALAQRAQSKGDRPRSKATI